MELRYREAAIADLRRYVAQYASSFFESYRDTGLWNADTIIASAGQNAEKLQDMIFESISARLTALRVIGRKQLFDSWGEIGFHVGSRLVIVYYSEDKKNKTRWIESISIDRKPIIF